MNKALVLNNVESESPSTCCNLFKKVDGFEKKKSEKLAIERKLTEKFNGFEGATFKGTNINTHSLYVDNQYQEENTHGVYRFKQDNKSNNYKIYFGPLIKVDHKEIGCGSLGCKSSFSGCKSSFSSCKPAMPSCNLGCKSQGGDSEQKLNFVNDEKNEEDVRGLNKYFGLRKVFTKTMDYQWDVSDKISMSEYIKNNIEKINEQFQKDLKEISDSGLGYHSVIDIPSDESLFTQAVLFSNDSNVKEARISNFESSKIKTFISRFDLWYFSRAKGLLEKILEKLYYIPVLGWILKLIVGTKDDEIEGTSEIDQTNIEKLQNVYSDDFNSQDTELTAIDQVKNRKVIAKTPVTIAFPRNMKWWQLLLNPQEYSFHTFIVDCEE
tara:strand:- start:694 stop:1836 length:1143 start_codon:yes stop_codon:yes gene_type:complete